MPKTQEQDRDAAVPTRATTPTGQPQYVVQTPGGWEEVDPVDAFQTHKGSRIVQMYPQGFQVAMHTPPQQTIGEYITRDEVNRAVEAKIAQLAQGQAASMYQLHNPQPMAPTFYIQGGTATGGVGQGGHASGTAAVKNEQETNAEASSTNIFHKVTNQKGFWQGLVGVAAAGALWKLGVFSPQNAFNRQQRAFGQTGRQMDLADECIRDTKDVFQQNKGVGFLNPVRVGGWPHNVKACSRYLERYNPR